MMPFKEPAAVQDPVETDMLYLLSDALDAGVCLLLETQESDAPCDQVLEMLQGFAGEASHLFASSTIEPSGTLFQLAAQARESREVCHMRTLSVHLRRFLATAKRESTAEKSGELKSRPMQSRPVQSRPV